MNEVLQSPGRRRLKAYCCDADARVRWIIESILDAIVSTNYFCNEFDRLFAILENEARDELPPISISHHSSNELVSGCI